MVQLICMQCEKPFEWERAEGARGRQPDRCSEACKYAHRLDLNKNIRRVRIDPNKPKPTAAQFEEIALSVPPAPRGPGRPPHEPTPESRATVERMAGLAAKREEIAVLIGITGHTLEKHYAEELIRGPAIANLAVSQNLHKLALGTGPSAVTAARYWMSCNAGWTEFAPAPRGDGMENMGKKEQAELAAQTAEVGTKWSDVLH